MKNSTVLDEALLLKKPHDVRNKHCIDLPLTGIYQSYSSRCVVLCSHTVAVLNKFDILLSFFCRVPNNVNDDRGNT